MRIEVTQYTAKGIVAVNVVHGEESLPWDVRAAYHRSAESDAGDMPHLERYDRIFNDINAFWDTLSDKRQNKIWKAYQAIHQTLMTNYDSAAILTKLQKDVKVLYDQMPMEEIKHWMLYHSDIRIPSTLKTEYGPTDSHDRTYLRDDYLDLVVLAIAVRPMVPVWGEFIGRTKADYGTTFKEFMAMRLMYYSNIAQCEPIERLRLYIEASVEHSNQQGQSMAAIMGGLGTTELPDWLMATTVVRRISIMPNSATDDTTNIISNVHSYITNTLRSMDRRFKGRITPKTPPSDSGDSENVSAVEMYKVKQEVSDGDVVILNVYTERPFDMLAVVDPTIDPARLQICLDFIAPLEQLQIQPHQITLAQYAMSKCLSPRGIPLLQKPSLMRVLAVTQAALWHWGYPDLAALATATPLSSGKDLMIGILESRGRIPKELMDELIRLFPHQHHPRGKNQSVRQTNVVSKSIDAFCELIVRSDWLLHCPPELLALTSGNPTTKKLIVPANIRAQLAEYHIFRTTKMGV